MKKLKKYNNFIFYSLIGTVGTTLDSLTLFSLNEKGVYYLIAGTIGFSIGVSINFVLNSYFNFKVKDNLVRRFLNYYSIGVIGLIITSFILYTFVDFFSFSLFLAKLVAIISVLFIQYNLNKKITFSDNFVKVN